MKVNKSPMDVKQLHFTALKERANRVAHRLEQDCLGSDSTFDHSSSLDKLLDYCISVFLYLKRSKKYDPSQRIVRNKGVSIM